VSDTQARLDAIDALEATIYQAIGTSHVSGAPLTSLRKLAQMAREAAELERVTAALRESEQRREMADACIDALEVALYGSLEGRSRDTLEARAAALAGGARAAQEDK
jgi:hypothetical protein